MPLGQVSWNADSPSGYMVELAFGPTSGRPDGTMQSLFRRPRALGESAAAFRIGAHHPDRRASSAACGKRLAGGYHSPCTHRPNDLYSIHAGHYCAGKPADSDGFEGDSNSHDLATQSTFGSMRLAVHADISGRRRGGSRWRQSFVVDPGPERAWMSNPTGGSDGAEEIAASLWRLYVWLYYYDGQYRCPIFGGQI